MSAKQQIESLSKGEAIQQLMPFVEQAHQKQGFQFAETEALGRAMEFFSTPEGDEKPVVDEKAEDQELAAVNLLFEAVHVGNHRGAYSVKQSATIYALLVHIKKLYENKDQVSKSSQKSKSSTLRANGKGGRTAVKDDSEHSEEEHEQEVEEEEEVEEIVPRATKIGRKK